VRSARRARPSAPEQLEVDFQELLRKERDPGPLREAARLLERTNQSDRWLDYQAAVAILRRGRSKAAVPLLLKSMIKHGSLSSAHVVLPEYAEALAILTGEELGEGGPARPGGRALTPEAVEGLVRDWWLPNRERVTTDPGRMSQEQLRVVVRHLLAQGARAQRQLPQARGESASEAQRLLAVTVGVNGRERPTWWREELHPAMVPALLAAAGDVELSRPQAEAGLPEASQDPVSYAAVPLLASLRADGEAPGLERIAQDAKQKPAARLVALLSLYRAGEALPAEPLLSILRSEARPGRRVVAALALGYSRDRQTASSKLLELLDEPDEQVRTAALLALCGRPPRKALPKFKQVLEEGRPAQAVPAVLRAVAAIGTKEAREVLALFLEAALRDPDKSRHLLQALLAFEHATGQRWVEAGAHPEAYYRASAADALEWWRRQKD
jgi:hypothetical protein